MNCGLEREHSLVHFQWISEKMVSKDEWSLLLYINTIMKSFYFIFKGSLKREVVFGSFTWTYGEFCCCWEVLKRGGPWSFMSTYKGRVLETMVSKKDSLCLCIYKCRFFSLFFLEQMVSKRMVFGSFTYKEWVAVIFTTTKKKKSKEGWPLVHLNKRMKNRFSQMV